MTNISTQNVQTDLGGDGADLTPEEAAKAAFEIVERVGVEDNGKFLNVRVDGWEGEEMGVMRRYNGGVVPW